MTVLRTTGLTSIFFLLSLDSQCSDVSPSRGKYQHSQRKAIEDMQKCFNVTSITNYDEDILTGITSKPATRVVVVPTGKPFLYTCCDNGRAKSTYRFGIYKEGHIDLSPMICRVEVKKKVRCTIQWGELFNASRYNGRVYVAYNVTSNCMQWRIQNIKAGDENSFKSRYRDDSMKYFNDCIHVILNVTEAPSTPVPTTGTTFKTKTSPMPTSGISTTSKSTMPKPLPVTDSPNVNLKVWLPISIIIFFALLILALIWYKCKYKRKRPMSSRKRTVTYGAEELDNEMSSVEGQQDENPEHWIESENSYSSLLFVEANDGRLSYGSMESEANQCVTPRID